ncbi:MAG TPA: ParB/RepB/Spo0J family partition protein [Galbitalea sp.]|nr:ParB/RepB/Spo0J family partition protein [Galbitalea sp.]
MSEGHVELARAVASIRVGYRLRNELGDLDELVESIRVLGLLQPITISPDGTLICGVRRYAAVRELGWKTVNVWVRSGISTDLERMLAEQHENTLRKPFTPTEAARLYAELKPLYQEDAARRKEATQFRSDPRNPAIAGPANFAGPAGDARAQAARAVTGQRSDLTLERILEVQHLAQDPTAPTEVREIAVRELSALDRDRRVNGHYLVVKAAQGTGELQQLALDPAQPADVRQAATSGLQRLQALDRPEDLARVAKDALARARATNGTSGLRAPLAPRTPPAQVARFSVRAFLMTIRETDYWWLHYDPAEIGAALTAAQWEQFDDWVAQAEAFRHAARSKARPSADADADPQRTLESIRQPDRGIL